MNGIGLMVALTVFLAGATLAWVRHVVASNERRSHLIRREPQGFVQLTGKDEMLQSFYDGLNIEYRTEFAGSAKVKEVS